MVSACSRVSLTGGIRGWPSPRNQRRQHRRSSDDDAVAQRATDPGGMPVRRGDERVQRLGISGRQSERSRAGAPPQRCAARWMLQREVEIEFDEAAGVEAAGVHDAKSRAVEQQTPGRPAPQRLRNGSAPQRVETRAPWRDEKGDRRRRAFGALAGQDLRPKVAAIAPSSGRTPDGGSNPSAGASGAAPASRIVRTDEAGPNACARRASRAEVRMPARLLPIHPMRAAAPRETRSTPDDPRARRA
jgi:hypothetical protein